MFIKAGPNLITSDEGYSVEILGTNAIEYREDARIMRVAAEVLGAPGIAVFVASIRSWEPPWESEEVPAEKRSRILKNIQDALAFCGEYVAIH